MSITVKTKPKELIPAGTYIARAYSMIHIGTVQEEYKGVKNWNNKVLITWELPTEQKVFNEEKGEQPLVISQEYTLFLKGDKSKLRKMLEAWRGKPFTPDELSCFDISKLIGVPCTLGVSHKASEKTGDEYHFVSSVSPLMKGTTCPPQINPSFEFSYEPFEEEKFKKLPEWLQKKIQGSKEYEEHQKLFGELGKGEYASKPEDIEPLPF